VKTRVTPFKPVIKPIVEKEINLEKIDKFEKNEKNEKENTQIGLTPPTTRLKLSVQPKGIPIKNFNEILMRQASINKGSNSDRSQVKKSDRSSKINK
jgi:hypothetical protein